MSVDTAPTYLNMGGLAQTMNTLTNEGPRAFYEGAIARSIASDVRAAGGRLSEADLAAYSARIVDPLTCERGDLTYVLAGGLTAGPTFANALSNLPAIEPGMPEPDTYAAYADALIAAYRHRLETMGDAGDAGDKSCTTHISAADAEGNIVMLTTTLLSRFGSRLVLPKSGVLMNNGVNWFDPRPGGPNSMAPGKRPLSNMCPMIARANRAPVFGLGASGGRKIMPAVFQLASFMNDCGLDLETSLSTPRIDVSGVDNIVYDGRLNLDTARVLDPIAPSRPWKPTTTPALYAMPSGIVMQAKGPLGGAHVNSPLAGVATA
ncbi:MAG: hypothetical protein CMM47_02100 [Rhodospirillaceae bacterium]|nr:hypothetical protein [Rhodospirillaceae bacterium]